MRLLNIRFMTIQLLRSRFYDWPATTRKLDDLARVLPLFVGLLKGPNRLALNRNLGCAEEI